jgi:hypothetical protein
VIALILPVAAGCAHHAAQKPTSVTPSAQATIPLPEWAPKNPSPEFLRAARVLRPMPDEMVQQMAGESPGLKVLFQRYHGTFPASYEFFGTLDDRQIEHFRAAKVVRIPAKSLTAKQKSALNHWFESWREVMKGAGSGFEDYLVTVYKMGGKEDLSNVDVGFFAPGGAGGHNVHIYFWVRMPDGKVNDFGTAFAII